MTDSVQHAKAIGEAARFTIILNDAIRDERISWRAKGILAGCMSHANTFQFNKSWIIEHGTEGRDAVSNALNELREFGYLEDKISKCEKTGKIIGWILIFKDQPRLPENPSDGETVSLETRQTGKPSDGKPGTIRRPINPENQFKENQVAAAPSSQRLPELPLNDKQNNSRFFAKTEDVPDDLKTLHNKICAFFNLHKGGAKTKRAFAGLISELLRIKDDKCGGLRAVEDQLIIAIKRSELGERKWNSITYDNWERYGKSVQGKPRMQSPELPAISIAFSEDMV